VWIDEFSEVTEELWEKLRSRVMDTIRFEKLEQRVEDLEMAFQSYLALSLVEQKLMEANELEKAGLKLMFAGALERMKKNL
jgi:hypothetical protein